MNLQKSLSDLEEHLVKLKEETSSAERRKAVAENVASNLEERNKTVIGNIEKEAQTLRESLVLENDRLSKKLESEIKPLEVIKLGLQDEIEALNKDRTITLDEMEPLYDELKFLQEDTKKANAKLYELNQQIVELEAIIKDNRGKTESLTLEIRDLEDTRLHIQEDLEVLNNEAEGLEDRIIEQDAQFKARKETLDRQLADTQLKLTDAQNALGEAQKKDKEVRESWADAHMKLDKREQTVRRMEARVSGAEQRIEELHRYDRL